MHRAHLLLYLGSLLGLSVASSGHGWSYEGSTGPSHWGDNYPKCNGNSQSPIDVTTNVVQGDASLNTSPLTFTGYDDEPSDPSWPITNNGHSVQVNLPEGYSISGGPLPGNYKAAQFHMHWGSTNSKGSEHTIDGNSYPLEIHIVHYSDQYTFAEAADKANGLAVIGILAEVGDEDNTDLASFFDALSSVVDAGSQSTVTSFPLGNLLPDVDEGYYTYPGSLTTPGCYESVIWTVMKDPIKVSASQLASLRGLKNSSGQALQDNFRPVQNLNGRVVRAN